MQRKKSLFTLLLVAAALCNVHPRAAAQAPEENALKLSGSLFTDERFLLREPHDWAWNENRLTLNLDKKIAGNAHFHSEVWLRNIGLPNLTSSAALYNKGLVDPYNLEIREAYVSINGFLSKKLDLAIGRQRIAWGTGDKLNPTDNLNPYDMEDILDFGRHRGSDAVNLNYYVNTRFSLQAVFIPFFAPANLPLGIFSNALQPETELPPGLVLKGTSDTLLLPGYSLGKSAVTGLKCKGFAGGVDFSLSYVYGFDGLPFNTRNTFVPVDTLGGIHITSQLSFARTHILGADMATSVGGVGFWAEAALFVPERNILMTNDLTALYPGSPVPVTVDSLLLDKTKPYLKFIVGGDYFFTDGSYLNLQYMHGFIHERGKENLNDYFFLQYEKKCFQDKLTLAPLSGGFIVADWGDIKENYAVIYKPAVTYQATVNTEITLSAVLFDGKGSNMFATLKDYNMVLFTLKYSF